MTEPPKMFVPTSREQFEKWFTEKYGVLHWQDKQQLLAKAIAFAAWEEQRTRAVAVIKQIMILVKETR